jgi:acyl carrier protein
MTTTFDGLRDIIVRDFELPPERLRRDTPLEEIELDSLAITELVFGLEDEFHVTAGNVNPAFKNLGDIADYIDQLIVERDATPKQAKGAEPKPARAAAAKSLPAGRGKSAAAPRAPHSKTARSMSNGAKSGSRPRAAANGALRAKAGKARGASAAPSDAAPRKRKSKRSSATASDARAR